MLLCADTNCARLYGNRLTVKIAVVFKERIKHESQKNLFGAYGTDDDSYFTVIGK